MSEKLGGNLIPTYESDAKNTATIGKRLGLLIKKAYIFFQLNIQQSYSYNFIVILKDNS